MPIKTLLDVAREKRETREKESKRLTELEQENIRLKERTAILQARGQESPEARRVASPKTTPPKVKPAAPLPASDTPPSPAELQSPSEGDESPPAD